MRRRVVLLLAMVVAALVVASGVALAATVNCTTGTLCVGTEEADEITGTAQNDSIRALGGDDTVEASGGNDLVDAGAGVDRVAGDEGNDVLLSGPGSTTEFSALVGGEGNDVLVGGDGREVLRGQTGTNIYIASGGDDRLSANESNGEDEFALGGAGDDEFFLQDDSRDFVFCGPGDDTVRTVDAVDVVASDCENVPAEATAASAATEAKMQDLEARGERWAQQVQENSQQRAAATPKKKR